MRLKPPLSMGASPTFVCDPARVAPLFWRLGSKAGITEGVVAVHRRRRAGVEVCLCGGLVHTKRVAVSLSPSLHPFRREQTT